MSSALAEVKHKIGQLEAATIGRRSEVIGTQISLETQVKGRLS